ncbi:MAG: hypothetical protein DWG76_05280 [Chloroflexi bacterium]|nr:hypothetical protein [Chloroflexota bacterium]MQC26844.1 hypothetical protein [Chloroflexota bacterium]
MESQTIILVNKPKGITSFDVIRQLRRKLGIRKMGHAGTLDPLASGLMIIGVNEGTKKLEEYLKLPKTYEADVLLGIQTTTGDMEGDILAEVPKEEVEKKLSDTDLTTLFKNFIGTHTLAVPKYSAIKVDGKALYTYAREGQEPPRVPEKEMEIRDIELRICGSRSK